MIYCSKICIFAVFTHSSLVWSYHKAVPMGRTVSMISKSPFDTIISFWRITTYQHVMDRETDGRTDTLLVTMLHFILAERDKTHGK